MTSLVRIMGIFILIHLGIRSQFALSLNPIDVAKQLHLGAYQLVKGAVEGATEVVGTPVDIKDVHFFLHTGKDNGYPNNTINPLKPDEIAQTNGMIYVFIHGWTQSRNDTPWFRPLTEFLLKKHSDAHVVQVDWSKSAADAYPLAAFSTESVGNIIGNLVYKLVKDYNVPLQNILIIGHSLGGQITGWIGKRFFQLSGTKLPRIIALDPAGPLFALRPDTKRLNKNDAEIVHVVHSDGTLLGFGDPCGTIDFFPNGGSDQPGCGIVNLKDLANIGDSVFCSHRRGYELFVETVKLPEQFMAKKCENYDHFKENKCGNHSLEVSVGDLNLTETGKFYLETGDKPPYVKSSETRKTSFFFL
ncbi:hypothetical protein HHI36_002643 [Cryptolaemus montrouzieri]|uniref:Lipase domain-containing protein n=1 Tax=Cryptolaemus montrouzieri TaxID=559131 RepID=A0ABD2PB94_9CUCU